MRIYKEYVEERIHLGTYFFRYPLKDDDNTPVYLSKDDTKIYLSLDTQGGITNMVVEKYIMVYNTRDFTVQPYMLIDEISIMNKENGDCILQYRENCDLVLECLVQMRGDKLLYYEDSRGNYWDDTITAKDPNINTPKEHMDELIQKAMTRRVLKKDELDKAIRIDGYEYYSVKNKNKRVLGTLMLQKEETILKEFKRAMNIF